MILRLIRLLGVTVWAETKGTNWQKTTLIYGENGRGKTSLSAVFRSLISGDATPILERRELTGKVPPAIEVLTETAAAKTKHVFAGVTWSAIYPEIELFDTAFVSENVYSGDEVDSEQRRRLHRFVLGAANVKLAEAVDLADIRIRTLNTDLAELEGKLATITQGALPLDDFLKLAELQESAKAIADQTAKVKLAEEAKEIAAARALTVPQIPAVDLTGAKMILAASLESIADDAEAVVRNHLSSTLENEAKDWLDQGAEYLGDRIECPFCGLDTRPSKLVQAYRVVFGEKYKEQRVAVETLRDDLERVLSKGAWKTIQASMDANSTIGGYWARHGVEPLTVPAGLSEQVWQDGVSALESLIAAKEGDVLASIRPDASQASALDALQALCETIRECGVQATSRNIAIAKIKENAAKVLLDDEKKALKRLELRAARYRPQVQKECNELLGLREAKKKAEKAKAEAKKALDEATDSFFTKYQEGINKHLKHSGCGYSITGATTSYSGGKPRMEYQLLLNGKKVELAQPKGDPTAPCFRNTLSDGDRSTLAFALFLARLDLDAALGDKVVIVDDPMTSLDAHRRSYTAEQCALIPGRSKQMVLLTHDNLFAEDVWRRIQGPIAVFEVVEEGGMSSLLEWDIESASRSDYQIGCHLLLDYQSGSAGVDPIAVARAIRPVLEDNLRMRFPARFGKKIWIGGMIDAIRNANAADPIARLKPDLSELEALNEFTKSFHHGTGGENTFPKPSPKALQGYVARALEFIYGR